MTFVDRGFRKWKDMKQLFSQHQASLKHKESTVFWVESQNVSRGKTEPVVNLLVGQRKAEVLENRNHLRTLILVTSYLARQGLSFRGDNESVESSNKGNFIELLELVCENDSVLRDRLKTRYGHYTSHEYQNDVIRCLANVIRKNVV